MARGIYGLKEKFNKENFNTQKRHGEWLQWTLTLPSNDPYLHQISYINKPDSMYKQFRVHTVNLSKILQQYSRCHELATLVCLRRFAYDHHDFRLPHKPWECKFSNRSNAAIEEHSRWEWYKRRDLWFGQRLGNIKWRLSVDRVPNTCGFCHVNRNWMKPPISPIWIQQNIMVMTSQNWSNCRINLLPFCRTHQSLYSSAFFYFTSHKIHIWLIRLIKWNKDSRLK